MEPNITAQQLVDLMPLVAHRRWRVVGKRICTREGVDPVLALLRELDPRARRESSTYAAAAQLLQMGHYYGWDDLREIRLVVDAANPYWPLSSSERRLRRQLLHIFGLREDR